MVQVPFPRLLLLCTPRADLRELSLSFTLPSSLSSVVFFHLPFPLSHGRLIRSSVPPLAKRVNGEQIGLLSPSSVPPPPPGPSSTRTPPPPHRWHFRHHAPRFPPAAGRVNNGGNNRERAPRRRAVPRTPRTLSDPAARSPHTPPTKDTRR